MQLRKPNGYWTLERCQEEALKYDTRKAFSNCANSAYIAAQRNKWVDGICGHMVARKKPNGYWTLERCHEEALKYETRFAFQKGSGSACFAALTNGWSDQICKHMADEKRPNNYWTFERCSAEASKYNTRTEFRRASPGAFSAAFMNGWRDQLCKHMDRAVGSTTDGNCFYLWLVVGAFFNGLPVYKFGVTSVRLNLDRIKKVANAGDLEYNLVLWASVTNAFAIERQVKSMGASPQYTGFDGCTEFRALTDAEVQQIKALAISEFVL